MNTKKQAQIDAIKDLQELLKPGDTVYTQLKHVSSSGMSRIIGLVVIRDNEPRHIGYLVSKALDMRYDRNKEGIKISGCGMDMGFAIVYDLGRTLFRDGFMCAVDKDGKRCTSNDHSNGDRDYTSHKHKDGGYALNHRWL